MNKKFFGLTLIGSAFLALVGCREDAIFYSNLTRSDVYIQQYSDTKYDFLWVLDNSASMLSRRQFVRDNIQNFLNILNSRKAVDFQMAVTTTDMFAQAGDLITAPGGLRVVKSTSTNVSADFASLVNAVVDTPLTSFLEQGLESAYQAIQLHGSEFSRSGVPLIIIFVSDEDDYSCQSHCWGPEPENNPDDVVYATSRYMDYFRSVKEVQSSHTYVFPIVGTTTGACSVDSLGARYQAVQEDLGGLGTTGSICNSDMQASYESIARVIGDRGMVFQLTEQSGLSGMNVYVDGVLIPFAPENYIFDQASNSIIFTGVIPRNGSVIQVSYSQKLN